MSGEGDELLKELDALLDRLALAGLSENDDVVGLHRTLARHEAVATKTVGRWDAAGSWRADGARSAPAWLASTCRMPLPSARRRVRLARGLRDLPVAAAAWAAGDIESAHVAALCAARNDRTSELLARVESEHVENAMSMRFSHFAQLLDYWLLHADPDGCEERAKQDEDNRRFDLSQTFRGNWIGDIRLGPIPGTIVASTLKQIEHELFEADWADAKARLGRDPLVHELARTPKQRRADALVEMATRARTTPKDGRRPEPLFTVIVGHERFQQLCELGRTVLAPGTLVPWLEEAWVERVVFDGPSRVIDVGAHQRLFRGATRRAVEVRDRGECFNELCDAPAEQLQVDHIQPFSAGGPTIQDNGRLACGFHNRERNGPTRGP